MQNVQAFFRSSFQDFFVAKVTAKTSSGGYWLYSWTEYYLDTSTGGYVVANPGRSGTSTDSPAYELNNSELTTLDVFVFMRVRGLDEGVITYEFLYPAGLSTTLSVCEGDGNLHSHTYVNGRLTARS